jgi:acetyl esterase/lipase
MWVAIALGVVAVVTVPLLFFALGRDSTSERSEPGRTTTTTTAPPTTPTTVGPQTVPIPPTPPPPSTGPPPAITVPRGSPRTTTATTTATTTPRTTTERSTTEPTVTAAPGSTTSPPGPSTSTTKPAAVTRRTVVYSPPNAPKRRGDLVLPREHGDAIVVLVHGGDVSTGSRKQMRGWADFYAQHGYPSFAIDYQLAKASTPSPVYPKPQIDVKAAVQYLRGRAGQLGLDADRVVVQGFDAGAALGAQALVTPDDPFFDGPGHYPGVSDKPAAFVGFYGRYDGTQRNATRYYGGPPDSADPKVQERYAKANSIAQAANAAGPTLLVQGDGDSPDLVASATAFRDALQSAGKDVTLNLVAGAGPTFDQDKSGALTPTGEQTAQEVADWLAARFPPS